MRFMLYNIRYGTGGHPGRGPFQFLRNTGMMLDRIVEFIQSASPDIIGLVEVDSGSYRSHRKNQAQVVAEAMGHYHAYRSKYGVRSLAHRIPVMRDQGNAFIVRDSPGDVRFHYFRKGVKRLIIELETPDVVIFLVHLALGARARSMQLHDLYALLKTTRKPVLVAGDFNMLWGEHEIQLFLAASGLSSADPRNRPSFPSWKPFRQLDFILHSRDIVIDRFDMPRVVLSDHLPLICDFHVRHSTPDSALTRRIRA